ncbi:MAG TPA: hypothetical protein DCE80_01165, partial [Ignavibacteriales bacterium]|nr:hypothetical protein [Ignavibacteriales bacterium]
MPQAFIRLHLAKIIFLGLRNYLIANDNNIWRILNAGHLILIRLWRKIQLHNFPLVYIHQQVSPLHFQVHHK